MKEQKNPRIEKKHDKLTIYVTHNITPLFDLWRLFSEPRLVF